MLGSDVRFKYCHEGFIIAFGPDDEFLKRNDGRCSTEERWSERKAWIRLKENEYEYDNEKSWKTH